MEGCTLVHLDGTVLSFVLILSISIDNNLTKF
jgi:hypothetical protein